MGLIRQVLVNDPENFDLPNINDLSNDNLRSYLLDLPIEGQTYFQSLMPAGILRSVSNDALKYPALLDTNCVHVSITGSDDVLIIKDGFGPEKRDISLNIIINCIDNNSPVGNIKIFLSHVPPCLFLKMVRTTKGKMGGALYETDLFFF